GSAEGVRATHCFTRGLELMATKARQWSYEFTGATNAHQFDARTLGVAGGETHGNCTLRLEIDVLSTNFGGSALEVLWSKTLHHVLLEVETPSVNIERVILDEGGFDQTAAPETPPTVTVTSVSGSTLEIAVASGGPTDRRYVVDVKARVLERGAVV